MFSREKAEELLLNNLKAEHLIKHSYAVEAVMRGLAEKLEQENIDKWGITGLLHDLDADIVDYVQNPHLHGPKTVEILKAEGFGDEDMYNAICAHNQESGVEIKSKMDQAIYAADPITGFITAITLVYPDKKISSVKVKSITKRMKEKRFAAGANREAMKSIEKLGIEFPQFAELSLNSMEEISEVLGL